ERHDNEFDALKNINIITGKYLLSLFYYKDIILFERIFSVRESDPIAQYNLGNHYYYCSQDYKKAFEWYSKSANNGCTEGQNSLGNCYESGIGIRADNEKAFDWYSKSANNGCFEAQLRLSMIGTI